MATPETLPERRVAQPEPIDLGAIEDNWISSIIATDSVGVERQYEVYVFTPPSFTDLPEGYPPTVVDELPRDVAESLHRRTFTDESTLALRGDDTRRFLDVDKIQKDFISDRGGRQLSIAVDEDGYLFGVSWLHMLQDDMWDGLLVDSYEEYRSQHPEIEVPADTLATMSTAEYGSAHQRGLYHELETSALLGFCKVRKDCNGVIARVPKSGTGSQDLDHIQGEGSLFEHRFETINSGPGFMVILALRDMEQNPV